MNSFMNYPLFNDVRNPYIRAYNRSNIYMNIKERHGTVPAERYIKKLDRNGQLAVFSMMRRFHEDGFEQTRRDIMRKEVA